MLSLILASALICQDRPAAKKPPESLVRQRAVPSPAYQADLARRAKKRIWDAAVDHDRWYGTNYAGELVLREQQESAKARKAVPPLLARPDLPTSPTSPPVPSGPIQGLLTPSSEPLYASSVTTPTNQKVTYQSIKQMTPFSYVGAANQLQPYYYGGGGSPAMHQFFQQQIHMSFNPVRSVHMPMMHVGVHVQHRR